MNRINKLKVLPEYQIAARFQDGFETEIDLRPLLGKGFSKELLDIPEFKKVKIDSAGGLVWPNGFDICPNYLREFAGKSERVA